MTSGYERYIPFPVFVGNRHRSEDTSSVKQSLLEQSHIKPAAVPALVGAAMWMVSQLEVGGRAAVGIRSVAHPVSEPGCV